MPTPPAGPPWSFAVPDASDESPIERIAGLFARHDVEFIVIGGQAEALHGSAPGDELARWSVLGHRHLLPPLGGLLRLIQAS